MPARCVYSGQSGTPVCTTVTAAFAVGRFCESSSASGRPSVMPRPRMHDLVARDRDLVVREQRLDARGRARHRARDHEREAAHVHRVQAVDVLVRVHLEQRGLVVDLGRRRVLEEDPVDGRVVVQLVDRGDDVGLGRVAAGRRTCGDVQPSSAAFACFMPT